MAQAAGWRGLRLADEVLDLRPERLRAPLRALEPVDDDGDLLVEAVALVAGLALLEVDLDLKALGVAQHFPVKEQVGLFQGVPTFLLHTMPP